MSRALLPVLASLLLAPLASAQIYTLQFSEEKDQKSHKDLLFDWNGQTVVLVELHSGTIRTPTGKVTWSPKERLSFYVLDPGDPLKLPYVVDDGLIKKDVRKQILRVNGDRVAALGVFMPNESFYTLSVQYQRKLDLIERFEEARDEEERGSRRWFDLHGRMLQELDSLAVWLARSGYPEAAVDVEKKVVREARKAEVAKRKRIETALESISWKPATDSLAAAANKIGGQEFTFSVGESAHLRILHHDGIPEVKVRALLELGEKAIESFRVAQSDPYLGEDFADRIPDGQFVEYFLCDDDALHYEKLMEEYYGQGWGSGEQRAKALSTAGSARRVADRSLQYWRIGENADLEGIVIHGLGHEIARRHYGIQGNSQDWLEEGVGYHLSFQMLNRNNVNCTAFEPPKQEEGTVARGPGGKKGGGGTETAVLLRGARDVMAGVALESGPPFTVLARKGLFDFENPDMAKSWAFYAFLAENGGKEGQLWLRSVGAILHAEDFPIKLRELTTKLFADLDGNAVQALEDRWAEYLRNNYQL